MLFKRQQPTMIIAEQALPGREQRRYAIPERHEVLGTPLQPRFP